MSDGRDVTVHTPEVWDRMRQAWDLRAASWTLRHIGERLGVSHETIRRDLNAYARYVRMEDIDTVRQEQLQALDMAGQKLGEIINDARSDRTKVEAIRAWQANVELRGKILGFMAPARLETSGTLEAEVRVHRISDQDRELARLLKGTNGDWKGTNGEPEEDAQATDAA